VAVSLAQKIQREHLAALMELKEENKDIEVKGLHDLIIKTQCLMDQKDVEWVENMLKRLAELKEERAGV
jgi:arginine deiminase